MRQSFFYLQELSPLCAKIDLPYERYITIALINNKPIEVIVSKLCRYINLGHSRV